MSHGSELSIAIEDYKSGLEKFVAMFANNYGLKLVFRGAKAYTNGKIIVVPELSMLERPRMSKQDVKDALDFLMCTRGFVYHEGSHIIYSEFETVKDRIDKVGGKKYHQLANVLEDDRIEYLVSGVYPGAKEVLIFTRDFVYDQAIKAFDDKANKISKYTYLMYAIGLIGALSSTRHALWSHIPKDIRTLAEELRPLILKATRASASTSKMLDIAEEIWRRLISEDEQKETEKENKKDSKKKKNKKNNKKKNKKNERSKGDKDDRSDGQDDDGENSDESGNVGGDDDSADESGDDENEDNSDGATRQRHGQRDEDEDNGGDETGDSEDKSESDETGDSETEDNNIGNGDGNEETPGCDSSRGKTSALTDDDDVDDLINTEGVLTKKAIENIAHQSTGVYRVYTTEYDQIQHLNLPENKDGREFVARLDSETRSHYGPLARNFENLLKARSRQRYVYGLSEGDLDEASLYRLAQSNSVKSAALQKQSRAVFKQRTEVRSLDDTVVALTVDRSGSMSHRGSGSNSRKDRLAMQCTDILGQALHAVGVPFEVTTWTTNSGIPSADIDRTISNLYTRFCGLDFLILKSFDDDWKLKRSNLQYLAAQRCNVDGESIWIAASRLMQRREKRKVMYVISDGQPAGENYDVILALYKHLKDTVIRIRQAGVEIHGVGVGAPEVEQFYRPHFINVISASELSTMVITHLKQMLHL